MIQPCNSILFAIENKYISRSPLKICAIYHLMKYIYSSSLHSFEKWWIGESVSFSSELLRNALNDGIKIKIGVKNDVVDHLLFLETEKDVNVLYALADMIDENKVVNSDYVSSFHPR